MNVKQATRYTFFLAFFLSSITMVAVHPVHDYYCAKKKFRQECYRKGCCSATSQHAYWLLLLKLYHSKYRKAYQEIDSEKTSTGLRPFNAPED